MDKVQYPHKQDQASKVSLERLILKKIMFFFMFLNVYNTSDVIKNHSAR